MGRPIRVGLTEAHGMAAEISQFGPPEVTYEFLKPVTSGHRFFRSGIKGYMRSYAMQGVDVIEAIMTPVVTSQPWVYSCANFQESTAFNLLGVPIPRNIRVGYIRHMLLAENCKRVMFWSQAGRDTLHSYGGLAVDDQLVRKTSVVYPAIRIVPDNLVKFNDGQPTLLFSGDFFRKGGVNVVDAFEQARRHFPEMRLLLCCSESDFRTPNQQLRSEYLEKVGRIPGIEVLGRVPRQTMIEEILPQTDVYLLPTYVEAFGMAILEAMAFGIPVIATNVFAIPEMITDNATGILIDVSRFDCDRLFRGYVVPAIPDDFRKTVTDQLYTAMCRLADSPGERRQLGLAALSRARGQFSFETRNRQTAEIYREALS